jgi:hypothetical protein
MGANNQQHVIQASQGIRPVQAQVYLPGGESLKFTGEQIIGFNAGAAGPTPFLLVKGQEPGSQQYFVCVPFSIEISPSQLLEAKGALPRGA